MTTPKVEVTILQNSLGIQPPTDGDVLAIVGPADGGALNTVGLYGRTKGAQADFVGGPLVEAAAVAIEVARRPVVLCRTDTTTDGVIGTVDLSGMTGTVVPRGATGAFPIDDYEAYVEFVDAGTVGTTGITYQWSLDGGRTMSPLVSLGTDVGIAIPDSGVSFFLDPVEAGLVTLVNDLRTDMLAHFILTTGSVHLAADTTSDDGVAAAASDLATALTLVNTLRTALIAHAANLTAHTVADTAITSGTLPAAALNAQEAVTLANALKAAYNTHRVELTGTIHGLADNTNVTTAADASHGTVVAGDNFSARISAPIWNTQQLDDALFALQRSGLPWDCCLILGNITTTNQANAIGTRIAAMEAAYKYKRFFCNFRIPNDGETESAYLTAFKAAFDAVTIYEISMSAGSQEFESAATRPRRYRRPPSWMAAIETIVRGPAGPAADVAYVNDGAGALVLGSTIQDETGNPKHHDEDLDPGLDTARALTLRSMPGYPGKVFITHPRTLAQLGTDFVWIQHWGLMCKVLDVAVHKLTGQLSAGIQPDPKTGRILDAAATDLENNVREELENQILSKGWAVSVDVSIDRTVNILSTPTIPVDVSVVPLAYVKKFALTVALKNPAYVNS